MDAETTRNHETLRRLLAGFEYAMLATRADDGALDGRPVQSCKSTIWLFTNAASEGGR